MFSKKKIHMASIEEMRKIDNYAVNHFGIKVESLMENAGRNVAIFLRNMEKIKNKKIIILSGKGHNGGDGLVAARFLKNWGADVNIILAEHPDSLKEQTKWNFEILKSMHVSYMTSIDNLKFENYISNADIIVDALFGYNLEGSPRGIYVDLINLANQSKAKTLAVDVPSGLNADTGEPGNPCIEAKWTLSFALPKKGFANSKETGEVYVADIGIPPEVFELMGLEVENIFSEKSVVRV